MRFLRATSTRRLLVALTAAAVAVGAVTAIALAAAGGGPVPAPKPLARAVRAALAGPPVRGVTARIKFTNSLIDSASLEGAAPLLKGGSGRLWLTEGHVRLELQSDRGDSQLVSDGKTFWAYDDTSRTVYRGAVPTGRKRERRGHERSRAPSLREIERGIGRLAQHADVSGAQPVDVAGQAAYSVRVAPHDGGLVGSGQLAFDAARGVPLRVGLYARDGTSPVLQLEVTDVAYGPVPASVFALIPPPRTKVVDVSSGGADQAGAKERRGARAVRGRAAVTKAVPFKLVAPSSVAGRRFEGAHLADWKGSPAAVLTYGRGLGGVAVIERKADPAERSASRDGEHGQNSLSLPRVRLNGASAEELATPLGTMIRFERAGVSYVVVGSVTRATAEAAARSLAP